MHPKKQTVFHTDDYSDDGGFDSDDEPNSPSEMTVAELKSSITGDVSQVAMIQESHKRHMEFKKDVLDAATRAHGSLLVLWSSGTIVNPKGLRVLNDERDLPDVHFQVPTIGRGSISDLSSQYEGTVRAASQIDATSDNASDLRSHREQLLASIDELYRLEKAMTEEYDAATKTTKRRKERIEGIAEGHAIP